MVARGKRIIRLLLSLKKAPFAISKTNYRIRIMLFMHHHNPDHLQLCDRKTPTFFVVQEGYTEVIIATEKEYIRLKVDSDAIEYGEGFRKIRIEYVESLLNEVSLDTINHRDSSGSTMLMKA